MNVDVARSCAARLAVVSGKRFDSALSSFAEPSIDISLIIVSAALGKPL
jgi:hypothetical protein